MLPAPVAHIFAVSIWSEIAFWFNCEDEINFLLGMRRIWDSKVPASPNIGRCFRIKVAAAVVVGLGSIKHNSIPAKVYKNECITDTIKKQIKTIYYEDYGVYLSSTFHGMEAKAPLDLIDYDWCGRFECIVFHFNAMHCMTGVRSPELTWPVHHV